MDFVEKHIILISTLLVAALYLVIGALFYLFLYAWKKNPFAHMKIQDLEVSNKQLEREGYLSTITLIIFCVLGFLTGLLIESGRSLMYFDVRLHSTKYFITSIFLIIFLHDTYFYWTHRLLHLQGWFQRIHIIHHLSAIPNPLTALAFHPVEAIIQAAFFPLMIVIFPIHPAALSCFLLYMVFMNVLGHAGFQLFHYGKGLYQWLWWNNSSKRHDDHHQYAKGNYGLYFTFWDSWMKTKIE